MAALGNATAWTCHVYWQYSVWAALVFLGVDVADVSDFELFVVYCGVCCWHGGTEGQHGEEGGLELHVC